MGSILLGAFVFLASAALTIELQAAVRTVCPSGCDHATIQTAIDAAADNDTLLVGNGTYVENLRLVSRRLTLRSVNGPAVTIIDGGAPAAADPSRGSVVRLTGGADCLFAGFTLTHGGGTENALLGGTLGGALAVENSRAALENCILADNSAWDGAAVGGVYAQVSLTDCLVTGNRQREFPLPANATVSLRVLEYGGSLSDLVILRSRIRDNASGGISVQGPLKLHDSLVSGNTHCEAAVYGMQVDILRAEVRDNDGSGIVVNGIVGGGEGTIADSSITGNRTPNFGGGIVAWYSPGLTVRNCMIAGNEAVMQGGGICVGYSAPVQVVNSVISGNSSHTYGGGIHVRGYYSAATEEDQRSAVRLENSTVSANWAWRGGGIVLDREAKAELVNSILWGDDAREGPAEIVRIPGGLFPEMNVFTASYSDIQGGDPGRPGEPWPGAGNLAAEPYFRSPRPAALAPTAEGDYHLTPCSRCIDAGSGDGDFFPGIPDGDFDGDPRPHGGGYDMGADEATVSLVSEPYPTAADDTAATPEELPVRIGVLANDSLPAGSPPSVTVLPPRHGTAVANTDGTVTYTPAANYNGRDTIFYLLGDGVCADLASVDVTVSRVADPPFQVCASGCAYGSIQRAIDAAGDGDTVLVHDGRYRERIDFRGKAVTVRSVNGPQRTVIDGDGAVNPGIGSVVSFRSAEGPESVLDGLTVTNGSAPQGGGIRIDGVAPDWPLQVTNPAPTVANCVVEGNRTISRGWGGGIYIRGGRPQIRNCVIRGNGAEGPGGGVAVNGQLVAPEITGCRIQGNQSGGDGGGLYAFYTRDLVITNSFITGNMAISGGGIGLANGNARLEHCTVSGNGNNGAHVGEGGALAVENSVIWGNWFDEMDVEDCSFLAFPRPCRPGTVTVRYSDVEQAPTALEPWPGEGNIRVDPRFVEPLPLSQVPSVAGNVHLAANSPCIDQALPQLASDDIDGEPRPRDAASDMGADEYAPAPLLRNDSFEEGDATATAWEGGGLSGADGRECTTALFGSCSFSIGGRPRADKYLRQKAALAGAGKAGDSFTLSGWSTSQQSTSRDGYGLEARISYTDGTTGIHQVRFSAGTHDWQKVARNFTAARDYRKILVYVRYARQGGRAWFDGVQLRRR